jgi:hypothetical protein
MSGLICSMIDTVNDQLLGILGYDLSGVNGCCRQTRPHFAEEDVFSVEDELVNSVCGP